MEGHIILTTNVNQEDTNFIFENHVQHLLDSLKHGYSPNTLCHFTTPISSFNSTGGTASTLNCIFLSNLCVWYHFRLSFCSQHPLTLKRAQNLFPTAISRNVTCISDSCFNTHYLTVIVHAHKLLRKMQLRVEAVLPVLLNEEIGVVK
jgi:hypothetical protein